MNVLNLAGSVGKTYVDTVNDTVVQLDSETMDTIHQYLASGNESDALALYRLLVTYKVSYILLSFSELTPTINFAFVQASRFSRTPVYRLLNALGEVIL